MSPDTHTEKVQKKADKKHLKQSEAWILAL